MLRCTFDPVAAELVAEEFQFITSDGRVSSKQSPVKKLPKNFPIAPGEMNHYVYMHAAGTIGFDCRIYLTSKKSNHASGPRKDVLLLISCKYSAGGSATVDFNGKEGLFNTWSKLRLTELWNKFEIVPVIITNRFVEPLNVTLPDHPKHLKSLVRNTLFVDRRCMRLFAPAIENLLLSADELAEQDAPTRPTTQRGPVTRARATTQEQQPPQQQQQQPPQQQPQHHRH